jgi:hypothetical protein
VSLVTLAVGTLSEVSRGLPIQLLTNEIHFCDGKTQTLYRSSSEASLALSVWFMAAGHIENGEKFELFLSKRSSEAHKRLRP